MSKYQNAKVYKIVSPHTDKVYVGSTCATLKDRLAGHISKFKNDNDTTSKHVLIFGDYEIVLIENVSCENVKELETRERFYIESMNCVNKNIPGRSKKKTEHQKSYMIILKILVCVGANLLTATELHIKKLKNI